MFKSIADIKRVLVIGSKWHCTHHGYAPHFNPLDMGIREVTVVQSNSFAFRNPKSGENSWCDWPKKSEVRFNEGNSFTIMDHTGNNPLLTYTLVKEN